MTSQERGFLVEFRDYLASTASPATTSTVAFSTLTSECEKRQQAKQRAFPVGWVIAVGRALIGLFTSAFDGEEPQAKGGVLRDIGVVFPLYGQIARQFIRRMFWIRTLAFVLTISIALLSAYVYWGNLLLAKLDDIDAQQAKLTTDRVNEEAVVEARGHSTSPVGTSADARGAAAPTPVARDCTFYDNAGADSGVPFRDPKTQRKNGKFLSSTTIKYGEICDNLARLADARVAAVDQLAVFTTLPNRVGHGLFGWLGGTPGENFVSDADAKKLNASAWVSMLNGYVSSVLMGLLGASAFILRSYLAALSAKTLHPRDARAYMVRLVLGAVSGLAVGFFMSPGPALSAQTQSVSGAVNITGPALAFLAGYAVEVLFGFLDTLSRVVFPNTAK